MNPDISCFDGFERDQHTECQPKGKAVSNLIKIKTTGTVELNYDDRRFIRKHNPGFLVSPQLSLPRGRE